MRFVFYTNSISPHQLPLARELVARLGSDDYRYVYTMRQTAGRKSLGWNVADEKWIVYEKEDARASRAMLERCDVLMSGIRDFGLFEKRLASGFATIYNSERWFKPIRVVGDFYLPGCLRILHPRHFQYARRMAKLLAGNNAFSYYPMGVWAQRDMELVCKLFHVPVTQYKPKIRLWGYGVAPSEQRERHEVKNASLRVLWVGRMIYWKRVDTLIRAVAALRNVSLDVYGVGPMKSAWRRLAKTLCSGNSSAAISFHAQVPIAEVRTLMRAHDVYVLPSNGEEGWGAAVNEALEEGMRVLGTHEAGSSATMLPNKDLFHAGDWRHLAKLLERTRGSLVDDTLIGLWRPCHLVDNLMEVLR